MTPKFLLIAALAVGLMFLQGSGAAPGVTDEQLAELDQKLEAVTLEEAAIFLKGLKQHIIKWMQERTEKRRVVSDKFMEHAVAKLSKESTPEEVAALEKRMSDFTVEGAKESMAKVKLMMDKYKSFIKELAALYPSRQ